MRTRHALALTGLTILTAALAAWVAVTGPALDGRCVLALGAAGGALLIYSRIDAQ